MIFSLKVLQPFSSRIMMVAVVALSIFASNSFSQEPSSDVLDSKQWQQVDESVENALLWLASKQQRNGAFPTLPNGQPGVTALCVMAFVSHGHVPGEGPYGAQLQKAVEFIVSCQKENGLIALTAPRGPTISRNVGARVSNTTPYNHAMSALLLSEVYSMGQVNQIESIDDTIAKALEATLTMQRWPKKGEEEIGGWRYLRTKYAQADLSVSGWQLMFLRSAKNAGFEVPKESIDDAVKFIRGCYRPNYEVFLLHATDEDCRSRGMAGAGILALAHAGLHDSPEAKKAGDWILENDFKKYNHVNVYGKPDWPDDRYHYSAFNCTQAMYQLGGAYWEKFYPPMVDVLTQNQREDGSWPAESHFFDGRFGNAYTTALAVMALGAPNQLLPIFQR